MARKTKRWGAILLAGILLFQPMLSSSYAAEETVGNEISNDDETAGNDETPDKPENTGEVETPDKAENTDAAEAPDKSESTDADESEDTGATEPDSEQEHTEGQEGQTETETTEVEGTTEAFQVVEEAGFMEMVEPPGDIVLPTDNNPPRLSITEVLDTKGKAVKPDEAGVYRSDDEITVILQAYDQQEVDISWGVEKILIWENGVKREHKISDEESERKQTLKEMQADYENTEMTNIDSSKNNQHLMKKQDTNRMVMEDTIKM